MYLPILYYSMRSHWFDFFLRNYGSIYLCSHLAVKLKFYVKTIFIRNHSIFCFHIYYSGYWDVYQQIYKLTDLLFWIMGILFCLDERFKVKFQIIYPKLLNICLSCVVWWWLRYILVEILNKESLTYFHWNYG